MSFILDALRKSDARRQQSGAPGLNSPEPPRPPRRRRLRVLSVLTSVLLVFAVAATAVYFMRPEWLPQRLVGGEEAGASGEQAALQQPVVDSGGGQRKGPAGADRSREQLTQRERKAEGREVSAEPGRPPAGQEDAAVEETQEPQSDPPQNRRKPIAASPERTVRREAPQRESAPVPAAEAMEELERRIAEQAGRAAESAEPPSGQSEESPQPADPEPRKRPQPKRESTAEPKPLNEGVAEYLRQWELPLSVRRSLPELNLTIHVFSPVEAERFVLINGERYVPGDAIGEAQIVDISRDGAIVDFRSHRFLLEPR